MALFIQQDDNRSKLQERLAAELREKAKIRAKHEAKPADGLNDSAYLKGTKQTTSLAWVWVLILVAAIAAMILIIYRVSS